MENQDIQYQAILQNAPINAFQECLHSCINDICGRRSASYDNFKMVTNWTNEEYNIATAGIKQLLVDVVRNHLNRDEICGKISELDENRQEIIMQCLVVRQDDIRDVLIQETCAISGPILQDFDWKVKWVMGSSKLSTLREPLLSLDLLLSEGKYTKKHDLFIKPKTVTLELDKEELNKIILVLEKAQEAVSN